MLEYEYLIRQRDYLLDISRALTAQLSLNEVLRRILRSATEMLSGKAGLIALADMPAIQPASILAVAEALAAGAPLAAPVYHGQRGHPIGFARRFREALMSLAGDRGGRDILAQHAQELRLIDVDDAGVLIDIDHPADLEKTAR